MQAPSYHIWNLRVCSGVIKQMNLFGCTRVGGTVRVVIVIVGVYCTVCVG